MKEALVNHWNLPDNSSLGRVPVTKEAGSQKTYPHSIKQTLTSRFEHRVMCSRSFHMEKGRLTVCYPRAEGSLEKDEYGDGGRGKRVP